VSSPASSLGRANGASAPAARATSAISSDSVETIVRSICGHMAANRSECSISGSPASGRRFFPGSPFEPARAGTTASTRGSDGRPTGPLLAPSTRHLSEPIAEQLVLGRRRCHPLRDQELVRELEAPDDLRLAAESLQAALVGHPLDRESLSTEELLDRAAAVDVEVRPHRLVAGLEQDVR